MNSLKIKKGTSKHSAYDLRAPNSEIIETHTILKIRINKKKLKITKKNTKKK